MSASDALNPRQFFHGSPEHLEPGAILKPTSETGKPTTRRDSLSNRVYVTPHKFVAAQYTWAFDHKGNLAAGQEHRQGGPAGHVYEVEPVGRLLKDKNAPRGFDSGSYHAREAKVVRKLPKEEWY